LQHDITNYEPDYAVPTVCHPTEVGI